MRKMTGIVCVFAALGLVGIASGQVGLGGGGGRGGADPTNLINNPSVKKELDLTEEQSQAIPEAVMKALSGVLNEKQYARFKQIELQQRGSSAFLDEKVQKDLKLTSTQKDSIKTIVDDSRKEMKEAFGGGGGGGKGNFEKIGTIRKETMEKITGVLTADQKSSWSKMTGEPFKLENNFGFGNKGGNFKKKATDN